MFKQFIVFVQLKVNGKFTYEIDLKKGSVGECYDPQLHSEWLKGIKMEIHLFILLAYLSGFFVEIDLFAYLSDIFALGVRIQDEKVRG